MFAINRQTGHKITGVCVIVTLSVVEDSFPAVPYTRGVGTLGFESPELYADDISTLDDTNQVLSYVDEDGNECGADDLVMTDTDPNPDSE